MRRRTATLLFLLITPLFAAEDRGDAGGEYTFYDNPDASRNNQAGALLFNLEIKENFGDGQGFAKLEGRSGEEGDSLLINEAYYAYPSERFRFSLGKQVLFWGSLEGFNITDVFNTKNTRAAPYSPFDKGKKYGSRHAAAQMDAGDGELSFLVKFREEAQPAPYRESPYFPYPLSFDDTLLYEQEANRPAFFLKYDGTLEEPEADYAFFLQNGYDNHRNLILDDGGRLRQSLYVATKAGVYATLVRGETLIKAEAIWADAEDETRMGDYYHAGLGAEYTLYRFWEQSDLSFYLEYYRSDIADETEIFQNDLFAAFRLAGNDPHSTVWSLGFVRDAKNGETIIQSRLDRRLTGGWSLRVDLMAVEAANPDSALVFLDRHRAVKTALQYHF